MLTGLHLNKKSRDVCIKARLRPASLHLFFFYRLCGYIVSTAPEVYVCHVFQCAPNAASLTKALAEACQVNNSFMLRNSL